MSKLTAEQKLARFDKWYSVNGHWLYESRDQALKQWHDFGIDGLPRYA